MSAGLSAVSKRATYRQWRRRRRGDQKMRMSMTIGADGRTAVGCGRAKVAMWDVRSEAGSSRCSKKRRWACNQHTEGVSCTDSSRAIAAHRRTTADRRPASSPIPSDKSSFSEATIHPLSDGLWRHAHGRTEATLCGNAGSTRYFERSREGAIRSGRRCPRGKRCRAA